VIRSTGTMRRFDGKVAAVTGGAAGIGAAIAAQLIAEGASVVIGDIDAGGAAVAAALDGTRAVFIRCDVTIAEDLQALVHAAEIRFGGLDLMFNNAGIGHLPARAPDLDPATWHKVTAVDLDSVYYGCRAAVPALRRRGGGAIVNTASISGLAGDYGFAAYSAAKGAVINYTRTLALDHARENIRVNALCPGLIATQLNAKVTETPIGARWISGIPLGRAGTPREMAEVALFLASDAASYMTGSIVVADGGVTAHTGQPDLLAPRT
jgi:meso-butanediol dehydrogenase / (S,S)-butanediol dehydrogenase / diacetyl reductase